MGLGKRGNLVYVCFLNNDKKIKKNLDYWLWTG